MPIPQPPRKPPAARQDGTRLRMRFGERTSNRLFAAAATLDIGPTALVQQIVTAHLDQIEARNA